MAQYSGTAGSALYLDGTVPTTIGEIAEWSLDLSMSPVDTTAFGDTWEEAIPSIRAATGSFSGNFDMTDLPQLAMMNSFLGGSAVSLQLVFGTAATNSYWEILTAYYTGATTGISVTGKGDVSYNFKASGSITLKPT